MSASTPVRPLRVLLIGNLSDKRCGFQNFTAQMIYALEAREDVALNVYDGTYSAVYERQQARHRTYLGFFPALIGKFDVVHIIWNAMTMNHYAGAPWADLRDAGIVTSWWDGGPSDATCPFADLMQARWSDYPREGFHYMHYPVPDWYIPPSVEQKHFTVGASSVRGDGVAAVRAVCEKYGFGINLPTPGQWLSIEEEIQRLSRSTVNVCWYNTPPLWKNRASAPSMLIAARRPILVNDDPLVEHLAPYTWKQGIWHGSKDPDQVGNFGLDAMLLKMYEEWRTGYLPEPTLPWHELRWSTAAANFVKTWRGYHAYSA